VAASGERVAAEAGRPVPEVEPDAIVPVEAASDSAEVAARNFRPRVRRELALNFVTFTGAYDRYVGLPAGARTSEEGFERTLRLNNRYSLDGRNPNSYANAGGCYGLHDRLFPARPVFGRVRSMTAAGLARKHDPEGHTAEVRRRPERAV